VIAVHDEHEQGDDQPEPSDDHQDDADGADVESVYGFADGEIQCRAGCDEENAYATTHDLSPSFLPSP
jgi:hypothetical protein